MADTGEAEGDDGGGISDTIGIQDQDGDGASNHSETVEAILLPEGTVSFQQEDISEDRMVTMQNVQLVGNNLVLMDGGNNFE